jgi:cell wall-associated NlpC family hydrolase
MPSVPVRVFVCVLACILGVLLLASVADAKRRPAKRRTHAALRHALSAHRLHVRVERRRRDRIVVLAWRAVGVPYRWGGASPRGFDCSGLTQWVYRSVGISLPHYTVAQWHFGRRVSRRALQPGDLLFFSGLRHVGIYLGHGALIHAPHPGAPVEFARLRGWFASSFYGARRLRLG